MPDAVIVKLRELGYDPDRMIRHRLGPRGYEYYDGAGNRFTAEWTRPGDWLEIKACFVAPSVDMVNHPPHYTSDPSGVECIQITRHRNFNIGNAIKYLWRAGLKADPDKSARAKQIEDLRKTVFYVQDEIKRLEALPA
ncbi:DUF3310 domain-containing protein [Microbacterium sp. SORGH_AS_0862]|uniref:DUF3310 domain-containing protein n=1 Tax=Microbacterium sp. SORGH_AS_0862 TaxID=3041789 RepID=UPI0027D86CF6|nr:DUF3310 domain-containing protein [Microbacterium sp. SORGH_AS_0862]